MDVETRAAFDRMDRYFGLIQQQLEIVNTRLGGVEDRIGRLEDRIGGLEDRVGRLEDRVGRLEDRVGGLEDRIGGLEDRIGGLEDRVGGLEDRATRTEESIAALRLEMRERFVSVDDQMRTLTMRMQHFEARIEDSLGAIGRDVAAIRDDQEHLTIRVKNVELGIGDLNARVDTFGDDMRQRFRGLNDRLAAVA